MTNRTYVYIDSFNLYYGSLNKPHIKGLKWLDLNSLLVKILPKNDIVKIKFFTARVSGKYDQTKPQRQDLFFRALKTLPNVEIIEGTFLFKDKKVHITPDVKLLAKVPEEKGTDVNLAIHLVNDAHNKKFDTAVIISNDSDLAGAVKIVTQELKLPVGILNPSSKFSRQLVKHATFQKPVREGVILNSQFPSSLKDSTGMFTKPLSW